MKFLVIAKPLPGSLMADAASLQAAKAYLQQLMEEKKSDGIYFFPSGGGMSISNADSHEALMMDLLHYPLYAMLEWETYPLAGISVMDAFIEVAQKR